VRAAPRAAQPLILPQLTAGWQGGVGRTPGRARPVPGNPDPIWYGPRGLGPLPEVPAAGDEQARGWLAQIGSVAASRQARRVGLAQVTGVNRCAAAAEQASASPAISRT
jgi:hypothetical protein